jgi:hypothetical protein
MTGSMGGGTGTRTMGNNAKRFVRPCLERGGGGRGRGRPLQRRAAGAAVSVSGPKLGGWGVGGDGGGRDGPPVPSPPRCGTIPPAPPPGRADGDNSDLGAHAAAHGNASNGNPPQEQGRHRCRHCRLSGQRGTGEQ